MGLMTKAEFNRLNSDDRSMIASGFQNSEDVDLPLDPKDQAIADRDAIIAAQEQKLQEATAVVNQAAQSIARYVEGRSA
jgi:hypothetical protein